MSKLSNLKVFSMTGYGVARRQTPQGLYEVGVKSVNGRFLEVRYHGSRDFVALEVEFKKLLAQYFQRGSVDVFVIKKVSAGPSNLRVQVNEDLANQWVKEVRALGKKLKLKSHQETQIDLMSLVRIPDLVSFVENEENREGEMKALIELFHLACESCQKERGREGLALAQEVIRCLTQLEGFVAQLHSHREAANQALFNRTQAKLQTRMQDLGIGKLEDSDSQSNSYRLLQEIVLLIDKSDITEELARLAEHLQMFKGMFQSASRIEGKKLDFYTQELLREVNTIGSKSQVTQLTQIVVEAKNVIEKIREQVQNLE